MPSNTPHNSHSNSHSNRSAGSYRYGYPAYSGGGSQPNVTAQWIFDEASGNIVDEVGGITLTVNGSPTFNVAAGGAWANLSPGITYGASGNYHKKPTATAAIAQGTSDYTIEWVAKLTAGSGTRRMISTYDGSTGGIALWASGPDSNFYMFVMYADATTDSWNPAFPISVVDGNIHKFRLKVQRGVAGGAELYVDGVPTGTPKTFSDAAKTINAPIISIGSESSVSNMTIYEVRFSNNATNNSGGPGGG